MADFTVNTGNPARADEELARQSQGGSLAAFEELVSRYERRVFGFVYQLCRHHTDAAEITQDTFVRAFQALEQFDPQRSFAAWLFAIARRKCIDRHRRSVLPQDPAEMPDLVDPETPADTLARSEESRCLWQLAREKLSRAQFESLWLRYVEDLPVAEIARVTRRTQTHVKVLLFRARGILAGELRSMEITRSVTERLGATPMAFKPGGGWRAITGMIL